MKTKKKQTPKKRVSKTWTPVTETMGPEVPQPSEFLKSGKLEHIRFGKHEVEEAARMLVRFFDDYIGTWTEFRLERLAHYCKEKEDDISVGTALFGLICPWLDDGMTGGWCLASNKRNMPYIVQLDDKHFAVTTAFIDRLMGK